LGDSGVLISDNECVDKIGELIHQVVHDEALCKTIISSQRLQLEKYKSTDLREFLMESFGSLAK
jgi:hypothetical protein